MLHEPHRQLAGHQGEGAPIAQASVAVTKMVSRCWRSWSRKVIIIISASSLRVGGKNSRLNQTKTLTACIGVPPSLPSLLLQRRYHTVDISMPGHTVPPEDDFVRRTVLL